uniref:Uncharacterized protein n=1 Tax=Picea glauca TaxID=3330 RepID=A0A117NJ81_PICGL|nr:hypothetical protein ABT39_MTgene1001 [Picea glauca]QHR87349.1 hypothetical protein Q903MT_gene1359 [Picea sitchensis]
MGRDIPRDPIKKRTIVISAHPSWRLLSFAISLYRINYTNTPAYRIMFSLWPHLSSWYSL